MKSLLIKDTTVSERAQIKHGKLPHCLREQEQ